MADQAISALTEVTAPAATDVVPIVNSGATKKVKISNLVKLGNVAIWARAYHNAAQSISSGVSTALAFNSERYDTDTIHDTSTNNSRLTCKTAGVYQITGHVEWAANATGYRNAVIRIGGSTEIANQLVPAMTGGIVTGQTVTATYTLAVNDYVELVVSQNSGSSINVQSSANYSPEFEMVRLGA